MLSKYFLINNHEDKEKELRYDFLKSIWRIGEMEGKLYKANRKTKTQINQWDKQAEETFMNQYNNGDGAATTNDESWKLLQ